MGRKNILRNIVPFHKFAKEKLFPSNKNLSSRFFLFQNCLEKKNSAKFLISFCDSLFFEPKEKFSVNFAKMLQNTRKAKFSCMLLILGGETIFGNIGPFSLVWPKKVVFNK